jgi:hypothetical protein
MREVTKKGLGIIQSRRYAELESVGEQTRKQRGQLERAKREVMNTCVGQSGIEAD